MNQLISKWYYPDEASLKNTNRDYYMDNLKFLLMILVVAGHFGLKLSHIPYIKYFTYYIYIFHMPCFVFTSGFFAKSMNTAGKLRADKIMNIMFMYLLFKVGNVLLGRLFDEHIAFSLFDDSSAPWYLVALCVWYLSVPLLERFKSGCLLAASLLIGLLVGYIGSINDIFSLSRIFVYFPFFIFGFFLPMDKLREFLNKKLRLLALIMMVVILLFVLAYGRELKPVVKVIYAASPYASYLGKAAPYGLFIRAVWYLLAIILSASFMLLVPRCRLFFSKYGSRTMQIYMTHIWLRNALIYVGFFSALKKEPGYMSYLVLLSSIIIALLLANKYFKRIYDLISGISLKLYRRITT